MTEEQTLYYLAARYPSKTQAGKSYRPIQRLIHDEDCDLSAYRFLLPDVKTWYVAVIGEEPPRRIQEKLKKLLTTEGKGEIVTLPDESLMLLLARRLQQIQLSPWVEGHYSSEM